MLQLLPATSQTRSWGFVQSCSYYARYKHAHVYKSRAHGPTGSCRRSPSPGVGRQLSLQVHEPPLVHLKQPQHLCKLYNQSNFLSTPLVVLMFTDDSAKREVGVAKYIAHAYHRRPFLFAHAHIFSKLRWLCVC